MRMLVLSCLTVAFPQPEAKLVPEAGDCPSCQQPLTWGAAVGVNRKAALSFSRSSCQDTANAANREDSTAESRRRAVPSVPKVLSKCCFALARLSHARSGHKVATIPEAEPCESEELPLQLRLERRKQVFGMPAL